jgi:hypothetical protein
MEISRTLKDMIIKRYNIMFNDQEPNRTDDIRYVSINNLMKITTYIEASPFKITCLEQNPNKGSVYGKRARSGTKIMWVILNNTITKKEKWLGRVENGTWYPKQQW